MLFNSGAANVTFELRDVAQAPLQTEVGTQTELELHRMAGRETIFLVLTRANVNDDQFSVTWDSRLSFVALDESLRFHVDDETGPDWAGADELELSVDIDGKNVYFNSWDDADTGEDWPNLVEDIRSSVQSKMGDLVKWVAFIDSVGFDVIKTDGVFAHGSSVGFLQALQPRDRDQEIATAAITISDPAGDGHLTARGAISKFPPF